MYETTLSSKGQLVLPAKARAERKQRPGTKFKVFPTPFGYELIEIPKNPLKALSGLASHLDISSADIKKMRREDDKRREKLFGI
ncbi:MAG: hypothetical protein HY544_03175 [Candidatus Diapherotrites archaeon]|uniref:AbrB/MazE/SpoVT family DNA-binding domain-containing protein n=1 Tax=Candidatus Iainarchaeum sp. TaxID=3101447 RepID=A0A8T3YLB6_9ARCH|nr:hypothetical protein [Candidatus Diapherotrites archaeon]